MSYREKLIKFMEAKAEKMQKYECPKERYFNEKDKKAIQNWTEDEAKCVWDKLKLNLENSNRTSLSSDFCPFCIRYSTIGELKCVLCEYRENHGECNSTEENDFDLILHYFDLYGGSHFIDEIFDYHFYKEIIEKIEKED